MTTLIAHIARWTSQQINQYKIQMQKIFKHGDRMRTCWFFGWRPYYLLYPNFPCKKNTSKRSYFF